jgi:hypothetical protein
VAGKPITYFGCGFFDCFHFSSSNAVKGSITTGQSI